MPRKRVNVTNKVELKKCVQTYRNGKRFFVCQICSKEVRSKQSLVIHHRIHTGEKPFVCEACEKGFICKNSLKKHLIYDHYGEELTTNIIKKLEGTHNVELKEYVQIYKNGKRFFVCQICSKEVSCKASLIVHHRIHTGEKPFVCKLCEKGFRDLGGLKIHFETHHPGEEFSTNSVKPQEQVEDIITSERNGKTFFMCQICDKEFTSKRGSLIHLHIHKGEKPFTCKVCEKEFSDKNEFKKHLQNQHPKENSDGSNSIQQSESRSFSAAIKLPEKQPRNTLNTRSAKRRKLEEQRKLQSSSTIETESQTLDVATDDPEIPSTINKSQTSLKIPINSKPPKTAEKTMLTDPQNQQLNVGDRAPKKTYVCEICGEEQTCKESLKLHLRTHTGKQVFVCAMCPESFKDRNACLTHMKLHTEAKKHVCEECKKGFMNKKSLKQHIKTHANKPFVCGMCPKSFNDRYSCVIHMKLHTGGTAYDVCEVYNKAFTDMQLETQHFQTQAKELFVCNICNYSCSSVSNLCNHKLIHSRESVNSARILSTLLNPECTITKVPPEE